MAVNRLLYLGLLVLSAVFYFASGVWVSWLLLLLTVFLIFQIARLSYVEEISDFLPLSGNHQKAMRVWQDISGANRLFVVFQQENSTQVDPDRLVEAVDAFAEVYQQRNLYVARKTIREQLKLLGYGKDG